MKFGISTACFYPRLTEITISELASRGIDTCEIFINTLSELESAYIDGLSRTARENGMRIQALHPFTCAFEPFMLFTGYDRRFEDALEWHRHYFYAMNRLGAEIFVFHGDRMQGKLPDEEYFQRFDRLRTLGQEFGVVVAQENVERCRSRSLDFLCRMNDFLDGKLSLVFDNKQALRSGVSPAEFLELLGRRVVHVHISDNGPEGDCLPLRPGSPAAVEILSRLQALDYSGAVMVELYGEQLADSELVYQSWGNLCRCTVEEC